MRPKKEPTDYTLEELVKVVGITRKEYTGMLLDLQEQVNTLRDYIVNIDFGGTVNNTKEVTLDSITYINNESARDLLETILNKENKVANQWELNLLRDVYNNTTWTKKQYDTLDKIVAANYNNGNKYWNVKTY